MKERFAAAAMVAAVFWFGSCSSGGGNSVDDGPSSLAGTLPAERGSVTLTGSGLAEKIEDGAILHCWCWSFDTIRENMAAIAAAGYSAVQTSPVSQCLAGDNGGMDLYGTGKWYYHYQPTEYVIGNYQLGTEDQFKEMCAAAHSYGVKVIVDAVLNHCTAEWNAISDNIKSMGEKSVLFHTAGDGADFASDRYGVTQRKLSGLWDWNTGNGTVQNYLLGFLKDCVAAGADGFRYDAAKHIELPDDSGSFASRFWPVVLENGSAFQYGEVLQGGADRLAAYQAYGLRTTASSYGERVRDAVRASNFAASYVKGYLLPEDASAVNAVTWVESHDNYCNDGTWRELDEQQVIRGYALIASRYAGTPLFFDRPAASSTSSQWGRNRIGDAGSEMYKDAQVAAVNFFHNRMGNSDERLVNIGGKASYLMVERGEGGAVIINGSSSPLTFSGVSVRYMEDGSYADKAGRIGTFTVAGGKLSGTVGAGLVAVIY